MFRQFIGCLAAAASLFLASAAANAQFEGPFEFLEAFDGDWSISFILDAPFVDEEPDDEFEPSFGFSGLDSWTYDGGEDSALGFRSHLYREWFYFRTAEGDYSDREYPLEALSLIGASSEGNGISLEFGDSAIDPFGVRVSFSVEDTAAVGLGSTITENITFHNYVDAPLDLDFFAYTDLDLDDFAGGDTAQLFSGSTTIRQTSAVGSRVDVRVTDGPGFNSFDTGPYSSLEDELNDASPTELGNNPSFGPGDATHAMQWGITLPPSSLDIAPIEITIEKVGDFADVVLPDEQGENGFIFNEDDPPTPEDGPRWYDPEVAVGYEYEIEIGDNLFAEVFLPGGFADGVYTVEILDLSHPNAGEVIAVIGDGVQRSFDFTMDGAVTGARAFRVLGIEPEVGLDPNDPLGFPTGLTFANTNAITFSQSAVVIPEPTSLALFGLAIAAVSCRRRRRLI